MFRCPPAKSAHSPWLLAGADTTWLPLLSELTSLHRAGRYTAGCSSCACIAHAHWPGQAGRAAKVCQ